jgi:DNA polymerase-3 subunit delta
VPPAAPPTAHKTLNAALKSGAFAPVYYLYGDDDFQKADAERRLVEAAVDPATRDFNLEQRRGAELGADAVDALLSTPPMLAERRVVVVRDPAAMKKDARAVLDRYLARPASDTVLVLVAPAGAKTDKKLQDGAGAGAFDFAPLTDERLPRWIAHHAQHALGVTLTPDAARLLQAAVGNDLHLLSAELDKLASYAAGHGEGAVVTRRRWPRGRRAPRRDARGPPGRGGSARRTGGGALVEHVLALPKSSAVTAVMALATQTLALAWGQARRARGASPGRARRVRRARRVHDAPEGAAGRLRGTAWGEAVRGVDRGRGPLAPASWTTRSRCCSTPTRRLRRRGCRATSSC